MRTTVTLDPDTAEIVQRIGRDRGMTVSQAVNEAIRAGDAALRIRQPQYTFPRDMGTAFINVDEASHFAATLEDDEIIARMERSRTERPG